MSRFREPAEAVRATVEIVGEAPRLGLSAHAGIAAGPAVFQDGDYFGGTVNMAARIAAHAAAGQTLVSPEVVDLADKDLRFREVGSVELKGISHPVRVFEPVAADAPIP